MNLPFNSTLRLLLALICVAASLLTCESADAASPKEERAFNAAAEAFRDGFWERAEDEFDDFARKNSKSELRPEAILLQAQARYKMTNSTGVVELLTANMDRAGFLADQYLFWIAEAYFQKGSYPAAAANYGKLIDAFPYSPRRLEAVVGEATAYSRSDQWADVVELLGKKDGAFAQAVQATPANEFVVRGLVLLAEAQMKAGNLAAAESVFEPLAGQKINPALDWQVQQLRSRILLAEGKTEEAWLVSTNLSSLAAASSGSRSQLLAESAAFQAQILERLNRLDDAIAVLQTNLADGVPVERQREALLKTAALSLALGKVPEARATLNKFLLANTNSPAADTVLLSLGELDLKQFAAGVPMSGTISTNSTITNRLQRATAAFDEMLAKYPDSALTGQALLGKGWSLWLTGDLTNSRPLFESATERLPFSEEQAVARFKWADAQMAVADFSGALSNYNLLVDNYAAVGDVKAKLFEPALYQAARAAAQVGDTNAASDAVAKILDWFPNGFAGDRTMLLVGQGFIERKDPVHAREMFDEFVTRWPESPLLPDVKLAVARSYEQEGDWTSAIGKYDEWVGAYTNSPVRPQAEFYRAWANYQAGRGTNALVLFTSFTTQFSTNDLAPPAQWWVADYYFRQGDFPNAEKNYKLLFQTWPASPLAYEARMMAGRAALGRADYPAAIGHFTNLTSDLSCPADLKAQALFAYGDTLIQEEAGTNKFANVEEAIRVFGKIHQLNATNEQAALAWGRIGDCYLQLAAQPQGVQFYDAATNAYQQAINLPGAGVKARSQSQVGIGLVLEKVAALKPPDEQQALLKTALGNYLDVVYGNNLRDGETADLFWVKKSGLEAARLIESLQEWAQAVKLYQRLETLLPPLRENLQKKMARAKEQIAGE